MTQDGIAHWSCWEDVKEEMMGLNDKKINSLRIRSEQSPEERLGSI